MPRNVSPSLLPSYPHWSWEVGCRGKFGTNPKGECYSQSPQPLWKEHNPTKNTNLHLAILQLLTSHMDQTYRHNFILRYGERKRAGVVIYCSINASCDRPMRRPGPLFAHGLRDNGQFSELKHVPTENRVAYPWESEATTPKKFTF